MAKDEIRTYGEESLSIGRACTRNFDGFAIRTVHCAVTVTCASGILSCSGAKVRYKRGVDISTDWNRGHGNDVNSCKDRSTELHSEYYN